MEVDVPRRAPGAVKKLSMPSRITAFALGIAGLGAGGLAVFVTHLEAGPVALLAVGLIFMIVGLAGTLPTRLKMGDNEAAWEVEREAVETFVERVAEDVPVANQREFLGALGDLAEDAPEVAAKGMSAIGYEYVTRHEVQSVIDELDKSYRGAGPIGFTSQVSTEDGGIDAVVRGPKGRVIAIQAKMSGARISPVWIDFLHQKFFERPGTSDKFDALLLVTRNGLTRYTGDRIRQYPEIHHVIFRGPQDRERLKRALREILLGPREAG